MDFDLPTDLINKAQIGFRQAAGLPSFHRNHTTPPSISTTIEASIPTLHHSQSSLKCKFCQWELLRGLRSLICIYCGEYQKNDHNSDPIAFNSTHGYSWLLQALNFNGSERVGSLAEGSGENGGQSPAEDELTLSELLDLKISWQGDLKKPKNDFDIETSEHNSSSNLGTLSFDFFTESKRDVVSDVPEEQPLSSKADQNKVSEDQERFSSDWNSEFQFADTKMENETLRTPNYDFFTESKRDVVFDVPKEQPVSSIADQNKTFEDQESFKYDWNAEFQSADTKMENENLGASNFDFFTESKRDVVSDVPKEQPVASIADQNKTFEDQESSASDWNTEFQFIDTQMENENLGASNFDFFTESKRDVVSDVPKEQPVASIADQNKTFEDQESSASDWNTEFQFIDTQMENENLGASNFDFFTESKRDVMSDVPEEQPVASVADQNKIFEDHESSTSDWNAEFQFVDTKMENENLGVPSFDFFTESKRDVVSDVPKEQPESSKAVQNKTFEFQESFTSDWNAEFQFADTKMENENLESVDLHVGADADLSAHMDMIFGQKENNKKPIDDSDPFQVDLFPDMSSVAQAKDGASSVLNDINFKNVDGDWFSDGNWQKSSAKNMDTIEDDNLFDIKPQINPVTFQSGNSDLNKSDKHHSEVTNWFQDGDGFDEWNDFTSSTGNQDSFQDSRKGNGDEKDGTSEKISELNLFPFTDDSQEVDFGKFVQSDIFSGDKNPSDTHAVYDIFSEVSTASRNANSQAGNSVEVPKNDEITPNATRPNNDVQMLMSQMHDLSFMLKNELSIPSQKDDLDLTHT